MENIEKMKLPLPEGESAYNTASRYRKAIVAVLATEMESRERDPDLDTVGSLLEIEGALATVMDEEYQKMADKVDKHSEKF
jgi:hypothetical protein